jgi:C4-dicarboxylate transporter, DctM subunit
MAWVMLLMPAALLLFGFPFFVALLGTAAVVLLFILDIPATALHQVMFGSLDQFALLAVPFFIFAGDLMARGNISAPLVHWATTVFGSSRGSLALTALGAGTVFGAISGATTAAVAAVGSLTYKPLRDAGYGQGFSAGLLTSTGAIANIIPPSIAMILYGAASHTSIVSLFAAGIFPGLLIAVLFGLYAYGYAVRHGAREGAPFSWSALIASTQRAGWAFGAPLIILGGIYGGIFTPTEAAGVACVYAMLVTLLVYRSLSLREIFQIAGSSMYLTAQIFIIVAAAGVYSWLLTISGAAQTAVGFVATLDVPPWAVLLAINIFLLIVGCVLDTASAILVLTPLLGAVAAQIGVDPVHFGVIMVMNLSIGTFTPPFGLNIFVAQAIFKVPLAQLYAGLVPFIALSIVALLIVTYIPSFSLWILRLI